MEQLSRTEKIRTNDLFIKELARICELEKDRIYCRHGMAHLLDVARIGRIFVLEEGAEIPADIIYAAALLHDIGRAEEYENGTPHDEASCVIARKVLPGAGYSEEETDMICAAIAGHRGTEQAEADGPETQAGTLARILKKADKLSRPCYSCEAADTCKWPDEKKNLSVVV